jgi:glycosyltransferase involved in cell wall biosynthesis
LLGIDARRIDVIYPGVPEKYFDAVPRVQGTTKPFVLCVGTVEPRKNIDTLLDAWLQLPASTRQSHELVFVGPIGWAGNATVQRLRSGIEGVRVLGYVPEADLPSLTAAATAFAYVSLYEGFGFPLAQAMAAGVPAVTSNLSSMPEVAGDAALLVDPHSAAEVATALDRLLTSETLREDLSRRGKERARMFTWKNSAERSAEFFTRVGG